MQILYASEPTPGHANEDFVIAGPTWAVVLDGASARPGINTGCIHDVPWFVQHLGAEFARLLTNAPAAPLDDALAGAITATRRFHEQTCDLANADSPSATVVAVRRRDDQFDYLTLADSPLIVDIDGEVRAIADDRTAHLPDYSTEGVRAARNTPDGFYVASTMPEAAFKAIRGTLSAPQVRRAALLSDGAARLVERFRVIDWRELLDLLDANGPRRADPPNTQRGPRRNRRRTGHQARQETRRRHSRAPHPSPPALKALLSDGRSSLGRNGAVRAGWPCPSPAGFRIAVATTRPNGHSVRSRAAR